jgi:hypothetical protein
MKKLIDSIKAFLCKHDFETVDIYDKDTVKAYCKKCRNKYVLNKVYRWKFRLDATSERDYEELRKSIQFFEMNHLKKNNNNHEPPARTDAGL